MWIVFKKWQLEYFKEESNQNTSKLEHMIYYRVLMIHECSMFSNRFYFLLGSTPSNPYCKSSLCLYHYKDRSSTRRLPWTFQGSWSFRKIVVSTDNVFPTLLVNKTDQHLRVQWGLHDPGLCLHAIPDLVVILQHVCWKESTKWLLKDCYICGLYQLSFVRSSGMVAIWHSEKNWMTLSQAWSI